MNLSDQFYVSFGIVVGLEGDFADDPSDSGGRTRFGITEAVARVNGYEGDMRDLPFETAQEIAKTQYWDQLHLDSVAALSSPIAHEMFDTSYNMGVARAGKFLQRALNALNRVQRDYPDVVVDGLVGPMTLAVFRAYLSVRSGEDGERALLAALNSLQGAAYIDLAERREKDERFVYGWLLNRVAFG